MTNTFCKCTKCGSTATLVREQHTVPSFDDEGHWDGEDTLVYETVVCTNPDCNDGLEDDTDDLPF
jgi:hypothetical protein